MVLLELLVVVAVMASPAATAARRVRGRGGRRRRQPRRLATALHGLALFLPHNRLGTKSKCLTQISRRSALVLRVLLHLQHFFPSNDSSSVADSQS